MGFGGGSGGVLNIGNLEFTLDYVREQPYSIMIDDLFMKCAVLIRGIIQGHPFIDGNKRTGFEVTDYFLKKNGYDMRANVEEAVEFTISVATDSLTKEEIRLWIEQHSEKHISKELGVKEPRVSYMDVQKSEQPRRKRENPYNLPEETIAMIDAGIRKNRKILEELAKY